MLLTKRSKIYISIAQYWLVPGKDLSVISQSNKEPYGRLT